jgi:hypothetical protein
MTSILHCFHILEQRALRNLERGRNPLFSPLLQLFGRNSKFDRVFNSIDRNDIAISD